ncbi:MAG TPA: hypothetical protein VMZ03_00780 [Chitinophagaceae bacterium]|nr:hypothetical protein [Chitinophagaceae bacterium]
MLWQKIKKIRDNSRIATRAAKAVARVVVVHLKEVDRKEMKAIAKIPATPVRVMSNAEVVHKMMI